jgi:hypothetical protein
LGANAGSIECGQNGPSTKKVPVMFDSGVQSNSLYWMSGWHEDGFCTDINSFTSILTASSTPETCVALNWSADFSSQAIGIEGILRTVLHQKLFPVFGINAGAYWLSDTLVPSYEGFPNLSGSVRGKPAETIIKHWFTGN